MTDSPARRPPVFLPLAPHHARYFAAAMRCRGHGGDVSAMGTALLDARVDLNPHQIEAALFAITATHERGRILAEEVGLGKTIEAALVLTQRWAERRRRLLVIVPASLRRQWASELEEKFGLPCRILDGAADAHTDFRDHAVLICSYHFAARRTERLLEIAWDLVVFDEAHRLRTLRTSQNSLAGRLVAGLTHAPKLLLTATPMQNNLGELQTLVSIVDEETFGDEQGFRAITRRGRIDYDDLRERLRPVCHRTLRRDVLAYVQYTQRHALTWSYASTEPEQALYDAVTALISRERIFCVPTRTRALIRVLLRKLLASSPAAVAGALRKLRGRLDRINNVIEGDTAELDLSETFEDEGFEPEWAETSDDPAPTTAPDLLAPTGLAPSDDSDAAAIAAEADELDRLIAMADAITSDGRSAALVRALSTAFEHMRDAGAPEKAVIFTESRRTQDRLRAFLERSGYEGRIVCFSGGSSSAEARELLERWEARHPEAARGRQRAVNLRAAIVERFQDDATILISTEAGSEGLNLQFCALVVNYDLPWNPQRLEQRIGRCHRYGQRHDVIVLNFVDETNQAERRVLELLGDKIGLFEGALGASDAILGAFESGLDFERRVHAIVDACRSPADIDAAFALLRSEMDEVIKKREAKAHKALFEHFDDTVHERLRLRLEDANARLDRLARQFWSLTRWALGDDAEFARDFPSFHLERPIDGVAAAGHYALVGFEEACPEDASSYRASHPLGEAVVEKALKTDLPDGALVFDISSHPVRVSAVERLKGRSGWLACERVAIDGLTSEEHIVLSGYMEGGASLDGEDVEALFSVGSRLEAGTGSRAPERLAEVAGHVRDLRIREAAMRNKAELEAAQARLDRWANDLVKGAEFELNEIRRDQETLSRRARAAPTVEEAAELQRELQALDARKRKARQRVFDIEDEVSERRAQLIADLERRARQRTTVEPLFSVAWRVV